jgi:hypothetical protein
MHVNLGAEAQPINSAIRSTARPAVEPIEVAEQQIQRWEIND